MALRASRRAALACSRAQAGLDARVAAVLGGQWGDEGKGKLADVLAKNYDVVGRFNGGANAGVRLAIYENGTNPAAIPAAIPAAVPSAIRADSSGCLLLWLWFLSSPFARSSCPPAARVVCCHTLGSATIALCALVSLFALLLFSLSIVAVLCQTSEYNLTADVFELSLPLPPFPSSPSLSLPPPLPPRPSHSPVSTVSSGVIASSLLATGIRSWPTAKSTRFTYSRAA